MSKTLLGIFVTSAVAVLLWYFKMSSYEQQVMSNTLNKVQVLVDNKLEDIEWKLDSFFTTAQTSVDAIANELNKTSPDYDLIRPGMIAVLNQPQCTAIGTHFAAGFDLKPLEQHFAKFAIDGQDGKLYAPFFTRDARQGKLFPYDYTLTGSGARNNGWYDESIGEGSWFGPYFGSANNAFLISYRSPIRYDSQTGRNLGNIVADYSLQNLRDFMAGIQLLDSGYGIIMTADGVIISHPVEEYLALNISDIQDLHLDIEKLNAMEQGRFHQLENVNGYVGHQGRKRLVYSRDFSARGWKILAVLNQDETLDYAANGEQKPYEVQHHQMRITFILLCTFSAFCLCLLLPMRPVRREWYISVCFSIACLIAINLIWYNHLQAERDKSADNIVVSNKTDLEAALNSFNREALAYGLEEEFTGEQIKIKTGFFIQSVKFSSANDIFVTGLAWQKLPPQWQEELAEDEDSADVLEFVLPEAESSSIEVIYSDRAITRWYFEASLRQSFNYLKYPFDDEDIWIRTRFREFYHNNIILVPDFDAYPYFERTGDIGLESDIFIEGWGIEKTYFYFRNNHYTSNFGVPTAARSLNNEPDLYFNISIRREFLGVFVAYMIPLAVIAYLLFAVLMIRTRDSDKNELFGFNSAMVLGYAASLFFVLIVSHMSLRETLQAKGIIYLEYFFFSLYIAIAIVAANSITYSYKQLNQGINDKWTTLLYWPSLLLGLLIITTMRFS